MPLNCRERVVGDRTMEQEEGKGLSRVIDRQGGKQYLKLGQIILIQGGQKKHRFQASISSLTAVFQSG